MFTRLFIMELFHILADIKSTRRYQISGAFYSYFLTYQSVLLLLNVLSAWLELSVRSRMNFRKKAIRMIFSCYGTITVFDKEEIYHANTN